MSIAWDSYTKFNTGKENYLDATYKISTFSAIFSMLPNLHDVKVTLTTFPFTSEPNMSQLEEVWKIPSTRHFDRAQTTVRFTLIFNYLRRKDLQIEIKSLSHDRLPSEFFIENPTTFSHQTARGWSLLSRVLRSLTKLDLTVDFLEASDRNGRENIHAIERLAVLVHAASGTLNSLSLTFQAGPAGQHKLDISRLLRYYHGGNSRIPIGDLFPVLNNLTLSGFCTSSEILLAFLLPIKSLRSLQLGGPGNIAPHESAKGGVHLTSGSFRELFATIKRELSLKEFKLQGDLVGKQSGERWVFDSPVDEESVVEYVTD